MGNKPSGRRGSSERPGSVSARLKDKLSFGATLVSVAGVAIFIGWLIGQYAIQAVTAPPVATGPLERPAAADAVGAGGSGTGAAAATSVSTPPAAPPPADVWWRVQAGAFSERARADRLVTELHGRGFEAVVVIGQEPALYRVQVGAFREEAGARATVEQLRAAGFEANVVPPR